jgi:ABC-type multidrug transport system fused ATPase/permease subunit
MKKASFNMTLQSLVVLILAITFLILAIVFIAFMFRGMELNLQDIFGTVRKQRIDQLKISEKNFDLEFYSIDLKPGDKKDVFMLLRNKENKEDYYWQITHSVSAISGSIDYNNISFSYKERVDILPGNELTPPIIIQADKKINKGTCLFEIKATDSTDYVETLDFTVNII